MTDKNQQIAEQIIELQSKVAYLEFNNEQLEQQLIIMLKKQKMFEDGLQVLHKQLEQTDGGKGGGQHLEPPPPHY